MAMSYVGREEIEVARTDETREWYVSTRTAPVEVCRRQLARDIRRQRRISREMPHCSDPQYLTGLLQIAAALQCIRHYRPDCGRIWFGGESFKV